MKNSLAYILGTCLIVVLSSCEKVIEPKNLPEQDPRLVINSIIAKDTLIYVNVSVSKSIVSGKDYKYLNDANVELYINDQFAERLKNIKDGNYISTKKGQVGSTYKIKVTAQGYNDAEGSSIVPDDMTIKRVERYDTVNHAFLVFSSDFGASYNANIKYKIYPFNDQNKKDWFSITPIVFLYDSAGTLLNVVNNTRIYSNSTGEFGDGGFSGGISLEADDSKLTNGNELVLDATISFYYNPVGQARVKYAEILVLASSASEDYYRYKVTLSQQLYNSAGLFSEPVIVYNNIKNGMGIVGCLNTKIISIGKVVVRKPQ